MKHLDRENRQLKDKLEDYGEIRRNLRESKLELETLDEERKKLILDLEARKKIDIAVDYLKDANFKACERAVELET